jgi:hypothetical protein
MKHLERVEEATKTGYYPGAAKVSEERGECIQWKRQSIYQ